jgi:Protein of unknown function (DUF4236)/Bacterial SH3 domain
MLKGLRWQKRLSIIPDLLRINLSKSGVSASAGPKGADINIGRKGVTTSAGIPGTGLSYRQKVGGGKGMLGILLVIAGLAWWAFQHWSKVEKIIAPMRPAATQAAAPAAAPSASAAKNAPGNTASSPLRYVHRQGAILREEAKSSGKVLTKKTKGDLVTLIAQSDGWAKVTDGNVTGWMRASVLGTEPPK